MEVNAEQAVRGWKQALGIVVAQQKAIDWCVERFAEMNLPQGDDIAREYWETVLRAKSTGADYIAAMEAAGVLTKN